jgi:ESCRT-I complex subunit VPS28
MSRVSFSLDEEVRLYTNNAEREKYNLLATLFGIVVALDYIERAYVRDSITAAEYVPSCILKKMTAELKILLDLQEIFASMYAPVVTV